MLHSRVVDNIVWSQRSKHELIQREKELRGLMEQHCRPLKEMETNAENFGRELPQQEATTQLLGLKWNKNTDEIGPNWHLNLTKKIKGVPSGDNLTPENIEEFVISRQTFTRFYAELYDPLGIFTPFLMSIKTNLRNICKMFGEKNQTTAWHSKKNQLHYIKRRLQT